MAGNTARIESGADTTLAGAVVSGESVQADVGGNLLIESYEAQGYEVQVAVAVKGSEATTPEQQNKGTALPAKNEGSAGIGEDSGEARSTTKAAISGMAGDSEARTDDQETGIAPIFDQGKVQQELDAQIKITAEFGKNARGAIPVGGRAMPHGRIGLNGSRCAFTRFIRTRCGLPEALMRVCRCRQ